MRSRLWAAVALSGCLGAVTWADDTNFRPYLIGARAAGMGGAFTALSDDGSGGYYNPGGLAFSQRSSISLTASVYGVETGSFSNALGTGRDFSYSDLNLAPVMTSLVLKLGPNDLDTGTPNHTLSLSVFVPDSLNNDDRSSLGAPQNAFFLTQRAQTIWAGAAYALRLGPVGLGLGAYGLIGSATAQLDFNLVTTDPSQFVVVTGRTDISSLAAVGSLGIRVDATDELSLGLSAFSPAVGTGSRHVFVRVAEGQISTGPALVASDREHLDAAPTLPLRLQLGAAWHQKPWTLAADLILLGPRDVTDNPDLAAAGFKRHVVRDAVVNGSFGGEYLIGTSVPLRLGVFTDFAASRTPVAVNGQSDVDNTTHVNRYGLTCSIGYLGEHVHTDIGVIGSYGQGRDLIPQDLDFTRQVPTDVKQLSAYVFLATSYGF